MFLHVHQEPLRDTHTHTRQLLQPTHICINACAVNTSYLLGAGMGAEKLLTAFPAASERCVDARAGVIADQVTVQMLHHPERKRTAVPLSTRHRVIWRGN